MKYHLCECGTVIVEQRGWDAGGHYTAWFQDLDGAAITDCPGCGTNLDALFGPSAAQKQRERALDARLYQPADEGLLRR